MTDAEQREATRQFINRWRGRGREDEDGRSYWIDLLTNVLGMDNVTERVNFEKKVVVDGNTKRIDMYIPETRTLIEQKSLGIRLDQKIHNSGDVELTPFEQAERYNSKLIFDERARWIVTCNFAEIWIYDMNQKRPEPTKVALDEMHGKYPLLSFLVKKDVKKISQEMEISIQAGELVGLIYDAFLEQYRIPDIKEKDETAEQRAKREHKLKSLNALCVRLVFCLYAEDAGIFGRRDIFHDYLESYDVRDCRRALIELFKVLDTPIPERDEYLEDDLAQFPYVNGGLFADESIEIPPFTPEIKTLLLTKASEDFDWRDISPTIFGAVFESTLNPETRRSGGMHYTSIENIHKVIDPLFMDDLNREFEEIKQVKTWRTKMSHLSDFQDKLASLTFLDPACGSGNFLTETYLSLRRLENEVIREKTKDQITMGDVHNPIKVSIQQFYGIEINDFAVTVGKTALWIAESQMLEETKDILFGFDDDFLPLKTYVNITEANALRIDWDDVVPAEKLDYIMGNPPFVANRGRIASCEGSSTSIMTEDQKADRFNLFGKEGGELDYVTCWYVKAANYIKGTNVQVAFVSTDSICQGQQVEPLWNKMLNMGMHINFAWKSFKWMSEASDTAVVFVVIVGFSYFEKSKKYIYEVDSVSLANNINPYLIDAPDIIVKKHSKPLCDVPKIGIGNKPIDGGFYLFEKDEMEKFIKSEPLSEKYFHPWYGSREFINRCPRYCLWLGDCSPAELRRMPRCMERITKVREYRLASSSAGTVKLADNPTHFHVENMPEETYIVIPKVSSRNRRYVPIGLMTPDNMCSDLVFLIPNSTHYHFGILTSNVHMAWMRTVCGYFGPSYRYSAGIVYNNFPWPTLTDEQKARIEQTAQGILDARAQYPDSSLADLYDPLTMPVELRRAHAANDKAVMAAYGFSTKMSEADCVAELMKLYQKLVAEE